MKLDGLKLQGPNRNSPLFTLILIIYIISVSLFTNVSKANAEDYISLWDKQSFLSTGTWTVDRDKQSLILASENTEVRNISFQIDHLIESGTLRGQYIPQFQTSKLQIFGNDQLLFGIEDLPIDHGPMLFEVPLNGISTLTFQVTRKSGYSWDSLQATFKDLRITDYRTVTNTQDYVSLWDKNSFFSTGTWKGNNDNQTLTAVAENTEVRNISFPVNKYIDSGILRGQYFPQYQNSTLQIFGDEQLLFVREDLPIDHGPMVFEVPLNGISTLTFQVTRKSGYSWDSLKATFKDLRITDYRTVTNTQDYVSLWDKNSFFSTGTWKGDNDNQTLTAVAENTEVRNISFPVNKYIDSGILRGQYFPQYQNSTLQIFGDERLLFVTEDLSIGHAPVVFEVPLNGISTLTFQVTRKSGYSWDSLQAVIKDLRITNYSPATGNNDHNKKLWNVTAISSVGLWKGNEEVDGILLSRSNTYLQKSVYDVSDYYNPGVLRGLYFSKDADTALKIYGDDKLLFEVNNIPVGSHPQALEVPLNDVKTLTIQVTRESGYSWDTMEAFFKDLRITNEYIQEWPVKKDILNSRKTWNIVFNTAVDPQSLNEENIYVINTSTGEKVKDVTLELSANQTTLSVIPNKSYESGQFYYLNIKERISSVKNSNLKNDIRMGFSIIK